MEKNSNIEMITGDPKKAINKLSLPIIASMFLIFANSIIDSIWVAGLGPDPLAALGYTTPLFMIIVGFGNGIGAGGNSLISRYIRHTQVFHITMESSLSSSGICGVLHIRET